MQWFGEAEFGMFIHFGLYSHLEGHWNGEQILGYAEWIQAYANIDKETYAQLLSRFNPTEFDADLIVKTAKEAGMKYLVVTAKHHEGFALYDSKFSDFDIASTPYKKDVIAQLKNACDEYGIRFGIYYSILDWHHPSFEPKTTMITRIIGNKIQAGFAKEAREAYSKEQYHGLIGHFTNKPKGPGAKRQYIEFMENQLAELIKNYDPEILWFDGSWHFWWNDRNARNLYNYVRNLKPSIIINNRYDRKSIYAKNSMKLKDYGTPEQFTPSSVGESESEKVYWESCYTTNHSWGFDKDDKDYKSSEEVWNELNKINANGGNLLLNMGPDKHGRAPVKVIDTLLEIGRLNNQE